MQLLLGSVIVILLLQILCGARVQGQELPTTYEYFTQGGIQSGLTADTAGFFKLNGRDLRIVSGAIHYFRVHPDQWRDRLRKLRAVGANAVETYVPWNLHEPEMGVFDFGGTGWDHSAFLNVTRFVEMAQEEDLLVIFRPGPYICAEYEAGGLPSWLQRDKNMQARSAYQPYLDRVKIYFDNLLPQVADQQFTRDGAIIAVQLENEYGFMRPTESTYMNWIKAAYDNNSMAESLYFTSDNIRTVGATGGLPGVLLTANLQTEPERDLIPLRDELQPNRPLMVAEYWSGWFDRWFQEQHSTTSPSDFVSVLEEIFDVFNGSVNFYMFVGGTNFGFINGANNDDRNDWKFYGSHVTSYDYDAVLTEAGDYTEKYWLARDLIERYHVPALRRPEPPVQGIKVAYPAVPLQNVLLYNDILARVPATARFEVEYPISMEELDMNGGSGQSFGYIVYRKVLEGLGPETKLTVGPVKDFGTLLIDGRMVQAPPTTAAESDYWINSAQEFDLSSLDSDRAYLFDVLVENMGHGLNVAQDQDAVQRKGIPNGNISVNGVPASGFQVLALEFKYAWVQALSNWRPIAEVGGPEAAVPAPAIFQSTFEINGTPADTFLDMRSWHKGIVFVNRLNLGRYFRAGPQRTLYVPALALQPGVNTITVFEQLQPGTEIRFLSEPILNHTPDSQ